MNYFEQTMKGSFSFKNDNLRETFLDGGIRLRIERTGFAIARVYFVNALNAEVPIPNGLVIHDVTNNVPVVPPAVNVHFFVLAWTDNYLITFNGIVVMELATQRQWSLRGPPEREIATVEN